MTLLHPWFLLLLLLVPLALRLRRGAPSVRYAPGVEGLPPSWRVRLVPLPRALLVAGLALAAVALARPVRRVALPATTAGIDILLCLDTSSSMTANDLDPRRTRLDVARDAAARFVAARPDDRVGLVSFARFPDVRCPPTTDHDALARFLRDVAPVPSDSPEDATGIGTAVARAAQVLRSGAAASRVVILLTDGEENVATARSPDEIAPVHAGQLCRELGIRVYAVAAGPGDVDTRQIERLAQGTGGRFFAARDAGTLAAVYAEIDRLERAALPEPRHRLEEGFAPLLAAGVGLLLLGRFLGATVLAVLP